jgi:hypothetical protein
MWIRLTRIELNSTWGGEKLNGQTLINLTRVDRINEHEEGGSEVKYYVGTSERVITIHVKESLDVIEAMIEAKTRRTKRSPPKRMISLVDEEVKTA